MTTKVKPTVEKWEEVSKKLRLCPECWTLSEGAGYCTCGGFKRLDFSDLPEKEQKMWIDGFERGESHSLQEAKAERDEKIAILNKHATRNWEIRFHGKYVDINYPDSPVTPDYEDYLSLDEALDEVIHDLVDTPVHA